MMMMMMVRRRQPNNDPPDMSHPVVCQLPSRERR